MKGLIRKFNYTLAAVWLAFSGVMLAAPQAALAASASLSLSPASTSLAKGSTVSLGIYVNSASPVNAVQANLSYPANLLDYVGVSSSSNFPIEAQTGGGNGNVGIGRGALNAVTGSKLVATVRFKAKTSTGTATVSFAGGSGVASNGTAILGGTSGASVALKAVPPKPAAAPEPPKDTAPPTISNVKVIDITNTSGTVTWTTSEPATSEVSYGTDTRYGLSAVTPGSATEHKVVLDSALLKPGITVHYLVKSVDPSGNPVSGTDQTFKTNGLDLTVTVLDKSDGKPVKDATVKFQKQTVTTDKKGNATLKGLSLESGNAIITQGGKNTGVYISVEYAGENLAKPVTVKIEPGSSSSSWPIILLIILFLLAVLSLWYFLRKARSMQDDRSVITPPPVVPETDPDLKSAGPSSLADDDDSDENSPKVTAVSDKPSKAAAPDDSVETVVIKPDKPSDDDSDTV